MTIKEAAQKLGIKEATLSYRVRTNPKKYGAKKVGRIGKGYWVLDGRKVK